MELSEYWNINISVDIIVYNWYSVLAATNNIHFGNAAEKKYQMAIDNKYKIWYYYKVADCGVGH